MALPIPFRICITQSVQRVSKSFEFIVKIVKYNGKVIFCKCNIDAFESLAEQYSIRNVPTISIFKDGKELKRLAGGLPKAKIAEALDEILFM